MEIYYPLAPIKHSAKSLQQTNGLMLSIGATCFGVLLLSLSACNESDTHGAKTKEEVVHAYLLALEKRDSHAMLQLIPETLIADKDVQSKIEQKGGHAIEEPQTTYVSDIAPYLAVARIRGVYHDYGQELAFQDEINLQQIIGRWYLMLGRYRDSIPPNITPLQIPTSHP